MSVTRSSHARSSTPTYRSQTSAMRARWANSAAIFWVKVQRWGERRMAGISGNRRDGSTNPATSLCRHRRVCRPSSGGGPRRGRRCREAPPGGPALCSRWEMLPPKTPANIPGNRAKMSKCNTDPRMIRGQGGQNITVPYAFAAGKLSSVHCATSAVMPHKNRPRES